MLATRLWMGTLLVILTLGMLIVDRHLAPVYPFLLLFHIGLALVASVEVILLLGPGRRPQVLLSVVGVLALGVTNWVAHCSCLKGIGPWTCLLTCFTALVLSSFVFEMAVFVEPQRSMERLALTWFVFVYLGLLPSYFTQLRWLDTDNPNRASVALALSIFVPKCGDIGAYFVGRLVGRHRMTPILSPKKTWEGALGGVTLAVLTAVGIDRLGPAPLLLENPILEVFFGITVAIAGMLGDLAESLIKRDCRKKDASILVPGFGGVLDVIDAIVFAAPVVYLWSTFMGWAGPPA